MAIRACAAGDYAKISAYSAPRFYFDSGGSNILCAEKPTRTGGDHKIENPEKEIGDVENRDAEKLAQPSRRLAWTSYNATD